MFSITKHSCSGCEVHLKPKDEEWTLSCTHSSPIDRRCWPIRRTISWSVWLIRRPGGCRSPLRVALSPLTWCGGGGGAPLVQGWCMSAGRAGGDSLRVRLRGGRCPAPSSPESVEARLARSAAPTRRARRSAEITSAPAASASTPWPSDVTAARYAPPALNRPSPFVRRCETLGPSLLRRTTLTTEILCTRLQPRNVYRCERFR